MADNALRKTKQNVHQIDGFMTSRKLTDSLVNEAALDREKGYKITNVEENWRDELRATNIT